MHKDDLSADGRRHTDYCKHSRNSKQGKEGHNRVVRRKVKQVIKAEQEEKLRKK